MDILITAVIALALGAVIGYLIANGRQSKLRAEASILRSELISKADEHRRELERLQSAHRDAMAAERDAAQKTLDVHMEAARKEMQIRQAAQEELLATERRRHQEGLEALRQRFDETIEKMTGQLQYVTSKMLKERQDEFSSTNRESMLRLVQPLEETIRKMSQTMAENTTKHSEFGGQLTANIETLMKHSDAARKSADRLADALRSGGKVQGDWGETVLAELLESQGLREGVHFDTQTAMRDAAGNLISSDDDKVLKPDVILHLDKTRDVIIDAKVSLSAYLDYMNAEDEDERMRALKAHVASVEKHVAELSRKNYAAYVQPPKIRMDYVIMFVPNTSALYAATNYKPDLWRRAMEQNVYIADEQTLYAALRIIDMTWRQIAQAENHEKVFGLANEMLKRVSAFMEKYVKIGKSLEDASKSYADGMAKLRDSGQSIPQTCQKLIKLGAVSTPKKGVPSDLLGIDLTDDTEALPE